MRRRLFRRRERGKVVRVRPRVVLEASGEGNRFPYFPLRVSLTERFLRPLERRRASTLRPFLEDILERNPCLLARFRRLG